MAIIQSEKLNLCGKGRTQSLLVEKCNNLGQFGAVISRITLHFEWQENLTLISMEDTSVNALVKISGLFFLSR